jgi:hypothetical protein
VSVHGFTILTVCALLVAIIVLGVQWKTIETLRQQSERVASAASVDTQPQEHSDGAQQSIKLEDQTIANELAEVREHNAELSTRVKQLEAQITLAETFMPGQEEPQAAYFGPGRWVRADKQSFFDEVIVSGTSNHMTIRVVAGTVSWPELELAPVSCHPVVKPETVYRRGLAQWDEGLGSTQQLLVTFEKGGIRIDWLRIPKGSELSCLFRVSKLKRVLD